jgi:drug/metabolite transporter (DMT)-like permease
VITAWLWVAAIVISTVACDVLQSLEMKQTPDTGVRETATAFLRRPKLMLSIFFNAVAFFAFSELVRVADLSFAVPATALALVFETAAAQWILKEHVDRIRWAGAALVASGVVLLAS